MAEYAVRVTNDDTGVARCYDFRTVEEAERAASEWRKYTHGNARVEIVPRALAYSDESPDWNDPPERTAWAIPELKAAADEIDRRDSRREIDWVEIWAVAGGVALALSSVVAFFCFNPAIRDALAQLWDALVQLLTAHPVITDNAIGAALTITGLAVIRYLRTRPREK